MAVSVSATAVALPSARPSIAICRRISLPLHLPLSALLFFVAQPDILYRCVVTIRTTSFLAGSFMTSRLVWATSYAGVGMTSMNFGRRKLTSRSTPSLSFSWLQISSSFVQRLDWVVFSSKREAIEATEELLFGSLGVRAVPGVQFL